MPFRVTARTILQLGAELISSDAVAFYELIKNAFDAGSKRVTVRVAERLPFDKLATLRGEIQATDELPPRSKAAQEAVHSICNRMTSLADRTAPDIDEYLARVAAAKSLAALRDLVDDAGSIEFSDSGEGMSLSDLDDVYLTIGTSSRLKTRAAPARIPTNSRPVLGEKGIGRLSAMRLGMRLQVKTTKEDESNWHLLNVDWREFAGDLNALVESVNVRPVEGPAKEDDAEQGTHILITALNDGWSAEKLARIAAAELSKLMDPFRTGRSFLSPSTTTSPASRFLPSTTSCSSTPTQRLPRPCHWKQTAGRLSEGRSTICSKRNRRPLSLKAPISNRSQTFESLDVLRSLGPFTMEAYWYNRRILEEITGIGDREQVKELIKAWSGGLMLFRNGFRVHPYGGPNDDWLDLDRNALAGQAFKVNRAQLIGKVDVTQADNPWLIDQTNREGLRDNKEKAAQDPSVAYSRGPTTQIPRDG